MKEIFGKYKERLVNINGKNRSLALKKLYKKRAFDIYNVKEFEGDIYEMIVEFFNNSKNKSVRILEDYTLVSTREKDLINRDKKDKIKSLKDSDLEIGTEKYIKKEEKINKDFEEATSKLEHKIEKLQGYAHSLKAINREYISLEKETGKRELYLGYPFVEGYFKNGKFLKAPLFLMQVFLNKNGDNWYIEKQEENSIVLNKVLLLALEKYNEVKMEEVEDVYNDVSEETIDLVLKKLAKYGMNFNSDVSGLTKFKEYTAKNIPEYSLGEGILLKNIILGQFPLASSVYNDYDSLIEMGASSELLQTLLKTETSCADQLEYKDEEEHGKLLFKENDLALISQIDYSQEIAVKKANELNSLVIYGPPGTGKSQTITNIISDALAKNKKILMVSQKRAALDVIYNRLGSLNTKAVIIHNVSNDKKKFYNLISAAINNNSIKTVNYSKKIEEAAEEVDNRILDLENIAKRMCEKTWYGLTLQEMYSKTKVINSRTDERYSDFRKYRGLKDDKKFNDYRYQTLKTELDNIDDEIICVFEKYNSIMSENKSLEDINLNTNLLDIDEAINNLEDLVECNNIIYEDFLDNKELFEGIKNLLEEKEFYISQEELKEFTINENKRINGYLTQKLNIGNWWEIEGYDKDLLYKIKEILEGNNYESNLVELEDLAKVLNDEKNSKLIESYNIGDWWNIDEENYDLCKQVKEILSNNNFNKNRKLIEQLANEINDEKNIQLKKNFNSEEFWKQSGSEFVDLVFELLNDNELGKDIFSKSDESEFIYKPKCEDFKIKSNELKKNTTNLFRQVSEEINLERNKNLIEKLNVGNWWIVEEKKLELNKLVYDAFMNNKQSLNEQKIKGLAKEINYEKNANLKENLTEKKWTADVNQHRKYFDETLNLFKKENFKLKSDMIEKLAREINEKENIHLKDSLTDGSWFNLKKWINYSANKKKEKELLNEYDRRYTEIFQKISNIAQDLDSIYSKHKKLEYENLKAYDEYEIEYEKNIKEIYIMLLDKYKSNEKQEKNNMLIFENEKNNIFDILLKTRDSILERYINNYVLECSNKEKFKIEYEKLLTLLEEIEEKIYNKYHENEEKEKENLIKFNAEYKELESLIVDLNQKLCNIYMKNKQLEDKNLKEFKEKYENMLEMANIFSENLSNGLNRINDLKECIKPEKHLILQEEFLAAENIEKKCNELISVLEIIADNIDEMRSIDTLTEVQLKALDFASDENKIISKEKLKNIVDFSIMQNILNLEKIDNTKEVIKNIDLFESLVDETNNYMGIKRDNVKKEILNMYNRKIGFLEHVNGYKEFKRQAEKKRALWPIRKYIEEYGEFVLDVFPCFLLGPETVSDILPLIKGMFDIVIFDEASQMYIESAIPSIYRANKVIIAGDDKQLRPSGMFKTSLSNEEFEDEEDIEDLAALEEESLLDIAKINYKSVHLTYHYRSKYEELINFSNYAFYDGRLKISPNLIGEKAGFTPIERVFCENGKWIDRENIEEANKIIEIVYKLLKQRENKESIGIITFNIGQKALIENMLEKKAQEDVMFRQLYTEEIDRVENNEDVSLFVKNIENVQGDERDIIIFSIGYGKNEKGRVSVNFGSLSQEGGENRLNVAISRAKQKIYVVTSIEAEELQVENAKNNGPKLFKKYLQYARAVSNNNREEQDVILKSLLDSSINVNTERVYDSDFEAEVYDMLIEKGYEVHTQVGVSGYKIDMAIYDKEKEKYILGIECDGAMYHSSKSARERDIHRQRYLESRGWNIIRVWSRHWWKNPNEEINKIQIRVQELKNK